eukprot:TRINITY_DN10614_c0_g1_i1.p1 TRINITY_DN10614_c0_g1~~TRINITY_DN10614_c0_g1_i1.p1  ORF type:complete len:256 (-),score=29.64 TRINITY_DN10614_c0_g1_i1:760-1473(-)
MSLNVLRRALFTSTSAYVRCYNSTNFVTPRVSVPHFLTVSHSPSAVIFAMRGFSSVSSTKSELEGESKLPTAKKPDHCYPSVKATMKHGDDRVTVTFLGTSSGHPAKNRNVTSVALRFENECILFDAGEGTQYRIQQAGIPFDSINNIFITHLHGDHCAGLAPLIRTIIHVRSCVGFERFQKPLGVFGPPGIRDLVSCYLKDEKEDRCRIKELMCPMNENPVMHETDVCDHLLSDLS